MHRLTATDTPMVRYTRTIFPSYAIKVLRSQIKSLDYIRKHSSKYREYNKQLEQKRNLDKQRA